MKPWKCTVCGYIHEGSGPPGECPRCGAGAYRFILYQPLSPELEQILKQAFAGESKAYVRNLAFSDRAVKDQYPQIARLFAAVAEAERVHAAEYLKFLEGVVGDTEDNLKQAFDNELRAKEDIYPDMIKKAYEAGRKDVVWSLIRARDVEGRHAKLYKDALQAMVSEREVVYHVCQVCGYVAEDSAPDLCPVCKSPREKFKEI